VNPDRQKIPNPPSIRASLRIKLIREKFHFLNIIVIAVFPLIFSIGASIWLLIPPSKRTTHYSCSYTVLFLSQVLPLLFHFLFSLPLCPLGCRCRSYFLSQELSSGDLSRIAAGSNLNLFKNSLIFDKSRLALVKNTTLI